MSLGDLYKPIYAVRDNTAVNGNSINYDAINRTHIADQPDVTKEVASWLPVVGDFMDLKDFYDSYKSGDKIGMALSAAAFVPLIGGVFSKTNRIRKGMKVVERTKEEVEKDEELLSKLPMYAKPNSVIGDAMNRHRLRLERGSYERLTGIKPSVIGFDENKRPIVDFSRVDFDLKDVNDESTVKYLMEDFGISEEKARKYWKEYMDDGNGVIFASGNRIYWNPKLVEKEQHLLNQMFDNGFNEAERGVVSSHEVDHLTHYPDTRPEDNGFSFNNLTDDLKGYFSNDYGTEIAARGSQIKDYFGLTNDNQKVTPEMLEYAKRHYIEDYGVDNNMKEFFESIKDYEKAARWISENASAGLGTYWLINRNIENKDDKVEVDVQKKLDGGSIFLYGFHNRKRDFKIFKEPIFKRKEGGDIGMGSAGKDYDKDVKAPWQPSSKILNYILGTEEFRTKIYNDGKNIPTIGYGFIDKKILDKYRKTGITKEQALKEFGNIVKQYSEELSRVTPYFNELTDNQKDALFSYYYNLGMNNYKNKSPKMQKALEERDYEEVASQMDFGYNDEDNRGLRKRRDYERSVFRGEDAKLDYGDGRMIIRYTGDLEKDILLNQAIGKNELEYQDPLSTTRGEAFRHARELGKDEFVWDGKRYSTKMKEDGGLVERQDYIYDKLTEEYDVPPMQAVAIVANLTHESGLRTGALGDSGASYGIQQWRDERRKNLYQFAKERGHVEPTIDDQIDYLMYEYNNGRAFQFSTRGQNLYQTGKSKNKTFDYYQFSKSDFDNAASLRDAVIAWNQGVGRPNKEFAMNDRRYKIAAEIAYRHGIKDGEKNYYNDMGYLPDGEMAGIHLPEVNIVGNQPEQIQAEEQKKTDYYNTYGRQIVSQMMSFNPESQSTPTSQDVSNESDKMDQDAIRVSKAIAENKEAEKRKMLIEAFLPNIQLAVKGVTQVGK